MGLFLSKQYIEQSSLQKLASSESKMEDEYKKHKVPVELKQIDNTKIKALDKKYVR